MESRRRFRRREDEDDEEKIRVAKTVTEKQRLRLEKLLKNIVIVKLIFCRPNRILLVSKDF